MKDFISLGLKFQVCDVWWLTFVVSVLLKCVGLFDCDLHKLNASFVCKYETPFMWVLGLQFSGDACK